GGDYNVSARICTSTASGSSLQHASVAPVQDGQADVTRPRAVVAKRLGVYDNDLSYLEDALAEAFEEPQHEIGWKTDSKYHISALNPPTDLQRRLRDLPQEYLRERKVRDELRLATSKRAGQESLDIARASEDTNWPAAHFLGPLHPVLEWYADRALASTERNEVLAVRGDVPLETFLVLGTITNTRGQVLNRTFMSVSGGIVQPVEDLNDYFDSIGL